MNLRIETINIEKVTLASSTHVKDHVLYVSLSELESDILTDRRIKSVQLNWVLPGESVRIVNVMDVIQPRCKIDPEGRDYPGWISKIEGVGFGRTRSLQGISVVITNRISKRPYSALLDMFGKGAELSKYGKMINLCVDAFPADGIEEREFEYAVKIAGMKTAVFLAKAAVGNPVDCIDSYDLDISYRCKNDLPRIAYAFLMYTPQHDYQGIPDPILYGGEVSKILPVVLHPNEILDGALVNANTIRGMETYALQNHALIKELYEGNGKIHQFVGVVGFVASMDPVQRERIALLTGKAVANVLGAEGVILNKIHGGMPHVDLALAAETCAQNGVSPVVFVQFFESGTSLAEGTLFNSEALDAVINVGQTLERILLASPERIMGGTTETEIFNPQFVQKAGDPVIDIEGHLLAGFHDHLGGSNIVAVDY